MQLEYLLINFYDPFSKLDLMWSIRNLQTKYTILILTELEHTIRYANKFIQLMHQEMHDGLFAEENDSSYDQ